MATPAHESVPAAATAAAGGGIVLATLASGQFVMALDSSVMNTAIATVAEDVGTTVTGVQTAITFYTLVMAAFMITGGKVGQILGRKRAFSIGCVIYACGSLTTALSQNLATLMIGWSFLEGMGAVLIMPAIVALVASNFGKAERPRAYGLVASAAAIAVASGPLIGGALTTYATWRLVFVGEVVIVLGILLLARRMNDTPAEAGTRLDLVGTALSALGLGSIVFGILKAGTWGFVQPKPDAPEWFGLSPVIWLILAGGVTLAVFVWWENRRIQRGEGALIDPGMLRNIQLRSGITSFLFMFLIQAGLFFTVPLFLSVALGISAVETGVRLLPLSLSLLLFAAGIPKLFPDVSPRRVVRLGFMSLFAGLVLLRRPARHRCRTGDRDLAVAARRRRTRRVGLAARRRDGVGGARGEERRGRRDPEHRQPARRVDRHRTRRRPAHLRADHVVLDGHREQPGRPRQSHGASTDETCGRGGVHL